MEPRIRTVESLPSTARSRSVARGTEWKLKHQPSNFDGRDRELAEMAQYLYDRFDAARDPAYTEVCKRIRECDYHQNPLPSKLCDALIETPSGQTTLKKFLPYAVYVALQQEVESKDSRQLSRLCNIISQKLGTENLLRAKKVSKLTERSIPASYDDFLQQQLYGKVHESRESLRDRVTPEIWERLRELYPAKSL